jgi:predicted Zn-dependent protease
MAKIRLFDGTSDARNGKILERALKELSHYQQVKVSPYPGEKDIEGYKLIKEIEIVSYNPIKHQVNLSSFLDRFNQMKINSDSSSQTIILLEDDIFDEGLNWCFGQSRSIARKSYMVVSTARIKNESHLQDVLSHELGHMYGAPRKGRTNTKEALGTHCTNNFCVMQQKMSVSEAVKYANERWFRSSPTYCPQCQEDLRR